MKFRLQTFSTESGEFVNEDLQSDDLESLKRLAGSRTFSGVKLRIVNSSGEVVFEATGQESTQDHSISDVAEMLGKPVDDPSILRRHKRDDDDD
jgi:hypothetical protein